MRAAKCYAALAMVGLAWLPAGCAVTGGAPFNPYSESQSAPKIQYNLQSVPDLGVDANLQGYVEYLALEVERVNKKIEFVSQENASLKERLAETQTRLKEAEERIDRNNELARRGGAMDSTMDGQSMDASDYSSGRDDADSSSLPKLSEDEISKLGIRDLNKRARALHKDKRYAEVVELVGPREMSGDLDLDDKYAANTMYLAIDSQYKLRNCDSVAVMAKRFLQAHRFAPEAPYAHIRLAICQRTLKQEDIARNSLKSIMSLYPDSEVAKEAEKLLERF